MVRVLHRHGRCNAREKSNFACAQHTHTHMTARDMYVHNARTHAHMHTCHIICTTCKCVVHRTRTPHSLIMRTPKVETKTVTVPRLPPTEKTTPCYKRLSVSEQHGQTVRELTKRWRREGWLFKWNLTDAQLSCIGPLVPTMQ